MENANSKITNKIHPIIWFCVGILIWICVYILFRLSITKINYQDINFFPINPKYLFPLISSIALVVTSIIAIVTSVNIKIAQPFLILGIGITVIINHFSHSIFKEKIFLSFLISDLSIIIGSIFIGKLITDFVSQVSWIIPITIVLIITDFWSVYYGLSAKLIHNEEIMKRFVTYYPTLGEKAPLPLLGMSDFIFLTLFLALSYKFKFGIKKNIIFMLLVLILVFVLVFYTQSPTPVLPYLGITFVLINIKDIEIKKKEIFTTFVFVLIIIAILFGISYLSGLII